VKGALNRRQWTREGPGHIKVSVVQGSDSRPPCLSNHELT